MSKEALHAKDITLPELAEYGSRVYSIDVLGVRFGRLHVAPDYSTVAWPGTLNFSELEAEVLGNLPHRLSSEDVTKHTSETPSLEEATVATFLLSAGSVQRVKYELRDPKQRNQYRQVLENPDQIAFVRYDVHAILVSRPLDYSFTAENPQLLAADEEESELAVQLPKSEPWSRDVVAWIIEHHSGSPVLKVAGFDLEEAADLLSDLVHSAEASQGS